MTMNNNTHSALRQALQRADKADATKLSSNFTYRTMLKVNELNNELEHKRELRSMIWTIAIVVFMILSGGMTLGLMYGHEIVRSFSTIGVSVADRLTIEPEASLIPTLLIFVTPIIILLITDHLLRRAYSKRHNRPNH